MENLITACLIITIIILVILIAWVVVMSIWHFKKEVEYNKEKVELTQSRNYHIKELEKRSNVENVDLH